MKNFILIGLAFFLTLSLNAQQIQGLAAYWSFDDCTASDQSGNGGNGTITGNPECECGVQGNALRFNSENDQIFFVGTFLNQFNKKDFTVSFFIKPTAFAGAQTILKKRESCSQENFFDISYIAGANIINVNMVENSSKSANVSTQLELGRCWQHIVMVRSGNRSLLYVNGEVAAQTRAASRVDILNPAILSINNGLCVTDGEQPYIGLVDELRIYDRALEKDEIQLLDLGPDRIVTNDTTVFLGNPVDLKISSTCSNDFFWTPATGLSATDIAEPTALPTETTTYTVQFEDNLCTAIDTIQIKVIDPADLECSTIFLPKAFTPNGDGLNDGYGISNPYAIQDLISFEIFDRWGGRVFFTDNVFETWNGNFKGQEVNPGVMLYRVRHRCDGDEKVAVGSLTILR